ncbi:hypothetical protein Aoki45_20030 [Algoriphagus sp. oki45]|uniref:hypothetical protein n=1 Tax=Algoriphagus sp. oki45 TaxID=3067294 RepID=UPI0027E7AD37|nr:hypothetical protein Aoki45_20030 [Algoriphagus sp. oki45]
MKRFITTLLLTGILGISFAQSSIPVNSNYLIARGISPKILDAALSATLQEGAYAQNTVAKRIKNGQADSVQFILNYDPNFKEGLDIQIEYNPDSLRIIKEKELVKAVEEMHSFSRLSKSYLYDESTLTLVSQDGSNVVLSFLYDASKLEPELKFGEKVKGLIYLVGDELEKVELVNTEPLKFMGHKVESGVFKSTIYFQKIPENGGYIVKSSDERYEYQSKKETIKSEIFTETTSYKDKNGVPISWTNQPDQISLGSKSVTVSGSLGGALPIFGKGARKLGYHLPRPVGISLLNHQQFQTLQFTDLSVGLNGGEKVSLNNLFSLEQSTVPQTTKIEMVRGDVWLFPFLNFSGMVGRGRNNLDGQLFLSDEFKSALEKLGFLVGLKPDDVPDYLPLVSELTALSYGGGVTLAGGVGNFNFTFNYQIVASSVLEANTTKLAQVFMPTIGYMTPFGLNIMLGAQGQYYETVTRGFLQLSPETKLDYEVNFEPIRWNVMTGLYMPLSNHFDLAIQGGFGQRRSMTAVLGYRFF